MIARFETITINNLSFSKSAFGEQSVTQTAWFQTRAEIHEVNTSIQINDKYRGYGDVTRMKVNYSPNMKTLSLDPGNYSITYAGNDWRIEDTVVDNNRQYVTMTCYFSAPQISV